MFPARKHVKTKAAFFTRFYDARRKDEIVDEKQITLLCTMIAVNFNKSVRSCITITWDLIRLIISCMQWCIEKFVNVGRSKRQTGNDCIEIIHRSENFLIINKPYDMYINSNNPDRKNTLQLKLREMLPDLVNPRLYHEFHFVHRLDYVTSGIICIALNKRAARVASCAFENQKVQKFYLALVHGHIHEPCIIIDQPIAQFDNVDCVMKSNRNEVTEVKSSNLLCDLGDDVRSKCSNHKMCTSDSVFCEKPRRSYTVLMVLEHGFWKNKPATKILLAPGTGRRHQLRVHCNYIGHTIIGDYTYSEGKDTEPHRTYLHSFRLILNCDIENIDVRTADPFEARVLSDYKTTHVTNILDENIFSDIYKFNE